MNLSKFVPLLFLLCMFTACIREDMSKCRECEGIVLNFEYSNFPDKINKVNIGIFDNEGCLVESRQIDKELLLDFQGVKLGLDAGSYTAICWANAFHNTQIKGFVPNSKLEDIEVSNPKCGTSATVHTNDSLFYGKHTFTIPADRKYTGTVKFIPAHIRFKICIKGLDVKNDMPYIRISKLMPAYDFEMRTCGEYTDYLPLMKSDNTNNQWYTRSDVLRFDYENSISVDLINSLENNILATVDICSFVKEYNISLDKNKEVIIPILITFENGDISITPRIAIWDENIVTPEW